jgi:CubicO group peptidase (beta-lactamase class C family)
MRITPALAELCSGVAQASRLLRNDAGGDACATSNRVRFTRVAAAMAMLAVSAQAAAPFEWQTASPANHGFSAAKLDALRDELASHGTKIFLLIRDDRILYEWYGAGHSATKPHYSASAAKALVGGTAVAIAISDGRLSLDDPAAKFVPQWRDHPQKSKITIRQLGSHTSGIEDAEADDLPHAQLTGWKGDFWKKLPVPKDSFTLSRNVAPLISPPGAENHYSNPGIAMLGYATTAALRDAPQKDLRTVLRDRVMRPIGVPDEEWNVGYGQSVMVDGLPLVPAWGGGNFTGRAYARIARLMLHEGNWEGQQLIKREAVRAVTADAGTPGNGGIGWWTNTEGSSASLPRDAYWARGAQHQLVLVIPSLKIIAVRNGGTPLGPNSSAIERVYFAPLMAAMKSK